MFMKLVQTDQGYQWHNFRAICTRIGGDIDHFSKWLASPPKKIPMLLNACIKYLNPHNKTPVFLKVFLQVQKKTGFYYAGKIGSILGIKWGSNIGK